MQIYEDNINDNDNKNITEMNKNITEMNENELKKYMMQINSKKNNW